MLLLVGLDRPSGLRHIFARTVCEGRGLKLRLFLVLVVVKGSGGVGEGRGGEGGKLREERGRGRVSKGSVFVVEMSVEEEGVHGGG